MTIQIQRNESPLDLIQQEGAKESVTPHQSSSSVLKRSVLTSKMAV